MGDSSEFVAIEGSLPNGFHDAVLYAMRVDFEKAEATIWLGADVSLPDNGSDRVSFKPVTLLFKGLGSLKVDRPNGGGFLRFEGGASCAFEVMSVQQVAEVFGMDAVAFPVAVRLFIDDTNSNIHVLAESVQVVN